MSELIAHEIEIAVTGRGQGNQPDELVQGDGTVDIYIAIPNRHVIVHVGAGQ